MKKGLASFVDEQKKYLKNDDIEFKIKTDESP